MATSGSSGSSRCFLFVIHGYNGEVVDRLRAYGATSCRYLCFGYEICPTSSSPHLQGYVAHDEKKAHRAFQKAIWKEKAFHMKTTDGTAAQNREYCAKAESKDPAKTPSFEEFGELPRQGARVDYAAALAQIKDGTAVDEVVDNQPHLLPMIRSLETYKNKLLKPLQRPVNVIVLWGDSGTGKSRWAYENFPDLYSKPPTKWWDGYSGQKTVLLDDFYGYIPHSELLNVLDRYPFHAEVKCSYVWAQWTTVIITSNKAPEYWYSRGLTPELRRRIHKIVFYSIDAAPETLYSSVPQECPQGSQD